MKTLEELLQDLQDTVENESSEDVSKLLYKLNSCGKIIDLLGEKTDLLNTKMEEILMDSKIEVGQISSE